MGDAPELRPAPLRSRRDETINALCAHFAQDNLSLEEFERRLDIAHRATAPAELDALLADLQVLQPEATPAPAAAPAGPAVLDPAAVPSQQTLIAIMGGVERRGRWIPARQTNVACLMGGGMLDFREAQLAAGITEVNVGCVMGGLEIIVPPGLALDMSGVAIMGGFAHMTPEHARADGSAPVLRIRGFVLMGGVEVRVRLPGETASESRRRLREEKKRLRRGSS